LKNGGWCGQIDPFNDKKSCLASVKDCTNEQKKCLTANLFGISTCLKWTGICSKLAVYCVTSCTLGRCTEAGFKP
jgi:hypothetical protein